MEGLSLSASLPSTVTLVDLYAFGSRREPRLPRYGIAISINAAGECGPESPPKPAGASLFANPMAALLHGHYHRLPKGTVLPSDLAVIADGCDVDPSSTHDATHHTVFPTTAMLGTAFSALFRQLPWHYVGRKP